MMGPDRFYPRPTHGYPSQRAAILALHVKGVDARDIAKQLDIHVNTVRARICSLKSAKATTSATSEKRGGRPVDLPQVNYDIVREMRPHAARRGITCSDLASRIIETVVSAGLVDAVLDDGEA